MYTHPTLSGLTDCSDIVIRNSLMDRRLNVRRQCSNRSALAQTGLKKIKASIRAQAPVVNDVKSNLSV